MLKEKAALLQKHDTELFGKKFRNHIADTIKSKRETREILTDSKKALSVERLISTETKFYTRGKKFFSPKVEDRITENSIMVAASFVNRHKQVNKDMVNVYSSSRTFFNMNSVPEISLKWELENAHPLIKRLFSTNKVPNVPVAGRLKHFSKAWKKLTRDQSILDLVVGYVIPFQRKPFQSKTPF